jgi:hypothetical protein
LHNAENCMKQKIKSTRKPSQLCDPYICIAGATVRALIPA